MHGKHLYMSRDQIEREAASLRPVIDAVLEHEESVKPTVIKVYEPRPLPSRVLSTVVRGVTRTARQPQFAKRSFSEMLGFDFSLDPAEHGEGEDDIIGMIVTVEDTLRIATPYVPPLRRWSGLYVLHDLEDYIELNLAGDMIGTIETAEVNLKNARYAIERLLPDGHELKSPAREKEDACIDGRA